MGWSLDLVIDDIHRVFGAKKHEVTVPLAARPYVNISYEGTISLTKKRKLAEMFPDTFYIYFYPDTIHEEPEPPKAPEFPGENSGS